MKGIYKIPNGKYQVRFTYGKKTYSKGCFESIVAAVLFYNQRQEEILGEFAVKHPLNNFSEEELAAGKSELLKYFTKEDIEPKVYVTACIDKEINDLIDEARQEERMSKSGFITEIFKKHFNKQ